MTLTKRQIDYLTGRFLYWKLPHDFNPDGGISFEKIGNGPGSAYVREPVGTNLFNANQAEAMVKFMIDGMPAAEPTVSDRISDHFRSGDVVCLVAGGPHMTVEANRTDGYVEVAWFIGSSLHRDAFHVSQLELVPETNASHSQSFTSIEALKDRPTRLQAFFFTDDETDQLNELQASVREHCAEVLEECYQPLPNHWHFARRMRRVAILQQQIRDIEDAARERDRIKRNTPLDLKPDLAGLAEGDGNT